MENEPSFLAGLFEEKAYLLKLAEETGKDMATALFEINRQIEHPIEENDPLKGTAITEPSRED